MIGARSGVASMHGIGVGGGVIYADYTGEVKVILRNHRKDNYEFKAGDRMAQLMVERIQTSKAIAVDQLVKTKCGTKGFGSSNVGPKRLITKKEHQVIICFLPSDPRNNTYYDDEDTRTHPDLTQEVTMLTAEMVAAGQMQTMDDSFFNRIRAGGKEDDGWMKRKGELS